MIQQWSWSLSNKLAQRGLFEEEDSDIYAFGLECLISDTLQLLIFFTLGLLLNRLIPMLLVVSAILCIKRHIGGWHANTHFLCILTSTVTIGCTLLLCNILPIQSMLIMLTASAALIFALAPIPHVNNPKTEEELIASKKKARKNTLLVVIICCALYLSPLQHLSIYVAGGLFWSAVTLLFPSMAVIDTD